MSGSARPTDDDYRRLLELRTGLRRFLRWSEEQAHLVGLTPAQHQLLLAIRGSGPNAPTVGDVAELLLLRQHSATGLVDRAARAGLVLRSTDRRDHRIVRLRLSPLGRRKLEQLSILHMEELRRLGRRIGPIAEGLDPALERT